MAFILASAIRRARPLLRCLPRLPDNISGRKMLQELLQECLQKRRSIPCQSPRKSPHLLGSDGKATRSSAFGVLTSNRLGLLARNLHDNYCNRPLHKLRRNGTPDPVTCAMRISQQLADLLSPVETLDFEVECLRSCSSKKQSPHLRAAHHSCNLSESEER